MIIIIINVSSTILGRCKLKPPLNGNLKMPVIDLSRNIILMTGRRKLLPIHSLKWNANDVLTTCKHIIKGLASGYVYWSCALRQKPKINGFERKPRGWGRCLQGNLWYSPPASMTSRLASVTFKMASEVFIEETDKDFDFITEILFWFLGFGYFKVSIVTEN